MFPLVSCVVSIEAAGDEMKPHPLAIASWKCFLNRSVETFELTASTIKGKHVASDGKPRHSDFLVQLAH